MNIEWLLIPTISGYWFLFRNYSTHYRVQRASGNHVFFQSAFVGILLLILARLIVLVVSACIGVDLDTTTHWQHLAPFPYSATALCCLALGISLPPLRNAFTTKEDAVTKYFLDRGLLTEVLFTTSMGEQKLVEITLSNRKSYIGLISEFGISPQGDSDVCLIPMASGYRDEKTLELVLTSQYAALIDDVLSRRDEFPQLDLIDFEVTLSMNDILSARIFDFEVYETYQNMHQGSATNGTVSS